MELYIHEVSLEEYLELRKNFNLNDIDRIDIGNVSSSGLVKIYYKSPQPINYKTQAHRYKPRSIFI